MSSHSQKPDQPGTQHLFSLASQHHQAGRLQEAEQLYRQILAQQPEHAEAIHNLAVIAHQVGRDEMAVDLIRQAIALRPDYAEAHNNLGNALKDKGQLDEAITAYRRAVALIPDYAEAHSNLGVTLKDKGQFDEAIACLRQAIALKPNYAQAHNNLGAVLKDRGQFDEAIAAFRQAVVLSPRYAEAHYNLANALLARGDFQQGWEEYEWRWECRDLASRRRKVAQPQWDGCPLEARVILLEAEQGFGDTLQFIRYLPLVAQRGGRILFECPAELQRLLRTITQGCQIVGQGQPLPAFDYHCTLLSLPRVFGTTLDNLPPEVPYLRPDADEVQGWQHRLASHGQVVKVGLAWAGSPTHSDDRNRSLKLAMLAALGEVPGVRFFSLQKGHAAVQAKTPPPGMELVDWTEELKDFADTAALIANLDLVIAVDTSVVHLAGAIGKPVWTLLPFAPDWRWLLEREDSPWYPSMRLFRQPRRGDWDSVIKRVAGALSNLVKVGYDNGG